MDLTYHLSTVLWFFLPTDAVMHFWWKCTYITCHNIFFFDEWHQEMKDMTKDLIDFRRQAHDSYTTAIHHFLHVALIIFICHKIKQVTKPKSQEDSRPAFLTTLCLTPSIYSVPIDLRELLSLLWIKAIIEKFLPCSLECCLISK